LRKFGRYGDAPGELLQPHEIMVDPSGSVYVIDQSAPVTKFDANGRFVWRLRDGGDPDLSYLHGLDVDVHGRLVLVNDQLGRIVYLSQDGHEVDAFGDLGPDQACEVTVDQQGRTYVTGCGPDKPTRIFDREHRLVGAWSSEPLFIPPCISTDGTGFALTYDGTILKLRVML